MSSGCNHLAVAVAHQKQYITNTTASSAPAGGSAAAAQDGSTLPAAASAALAPSTSRYGSHAQLLLDIQRPL